MIEKTISKPNGFVGGSHKRERERETVTPRVKSTRREFELDKLLPDVAGHRRIGFVASERPRLDTASRTQKSSLLQKRGLSESDVFKAWSEHLPYFYARQEAGNRNVYSVCDQIIGNSKDWWSYDDLLPKSAFLNAAVGIAPDKEIILGTRDHLLMMKVPKIVLCSMLDPICHDSPLKEEVKIYLHTLFSGFLPEIEDRAVAVSFLEGMNEREKRKAADLAVVRLACGPSSEFLDSLLKNWNNSNATEIEDVLVRPALTVAVYTDSIAEVRVLLAHGANPLFASREGGDKHDMVMVPWDFAFESERGDHVHRPEIEALLRAAIVRSGRLPPRPDIVKRGETDCSL